MWSQIQSAHRYSYYHVLVCHVIEFDHNHVLLDGIMCGLLPAHRKMTETDVQDV
jgi:hypothetical protein